MRLRFDEAEAVVKHLTDKGVEAKNIHIELQSAIPWGANVIMASNGTIGNQIFRSIVFLGNGANLASPTIFPGVGQYEDNFRNEEDWYSHIVAAAAYANASSSTNHSPMNLPSPLSRNSPMRVVRRSVSHSIRQRRLSSLR